MDRSGTSDMSFRLEVPADPAFIGTMRLFAASVARQFAMEESLVSDLKLAVSEACAYLITRRSDGAGMSVSITTGTGRIAIEVAEFDSPSRTDPAITSSSSQPAIEQAVDLNRDVIGALFPDAHFSEDDRSISLSISTEVEPIES